jgi:hypothetical protein
MFGGVLLLSGCGQGSIPMIVLGFIMAFFAMLTTTDHRVEHVGTNGAIIIADNEIGDRPSFH